MSPIRVRSAIDCVALVLLLSGILLTKTAPASAGILDATWIAPTTNIDGSPLTDLSSYRVYYGPAPSPCPGPSLLSVASPTSSPTSNESVSLQLTGLATGSLYYVAVTALDTSGNESTCSPTASAVARAEFDVSPNGMVNFGSVNVGSSAEGTFTVSNTAEGTVSGSAAVAPPFTIVSGSPFTLAGVGATRSVTVRFTPTTTATVSSTISFSANGATVNRVVTGGGTDDGTGTDTDRPSISIASPTSGTTYTTQRAWLTLRGTASDNVGVTRVTWTNSRGGSGTATGTTSWTASGIYLKWGLNVLTVTALDDAGNGGTTTLSVTYNRWN
jgi:Big-like domain-containing protein/HYDIN/CFA65/VesB family protein